VAKWKSDGLQRSRISFIGIAMPFYLIEKFCTFLSRVSHPSVKDLSSARCSAKEIICNNNGDRKQEPKLVGQCG
jgi:hypothetical protein